MGWVNSGNLSVKCESIQEAESIIIHLPNFAFVLFAPDEGLKPQPCHHQTRAVFQY